MTGGRGGRRGSQLHRGAGVQIDRFGSWVVRWGSTGFSIRSTRRELCRSFVFNRIVLPVGLDFDSAKAVLTLDPYSGLDVLEGAPKDDLIRFKRKLSGLVLSTVRRSDSGCADCADEAGSV